MAKLVKINGLVSKAVSRKEEIDRLKESGRSTSKPYQALYDMAGSTYMDCLRCGLPVRYMDTTYGTFVGGMVKSSNPDVDYHINHQDKRITTQASMNVDLSDKGYFKSEVERYIPVTKTGRVCPSCSVHVKEKQESQVTQRTTKSYKGW